MLRIQGKKFRLDKVRMVLFMALAFFIVLPLSHAQVVRLKATGDIWLSDANKRERNRSKGNSKRFKLKSIQEMAALRFDTRPILNRNIHSARLFLHPSISDNQLRYIRISTINQNWTEGSHWRPDFLGDGASYNWADPVLRRSWAWPGSQFCDVSFSSGHSLDSWAELRIEKTTWISVDVDPKLIIAMAVNDTDGLAIMDGGTYNPFNNFVHSSESVKYAPYLLVTIGPKVSFVPDMPMVRIDPDPTHAGIDSGAVIVWINEDPSVFCWRVSVNGHPLERWQIPHPSKGKSTKFYIANLPPSVQTQIQVTAVSSSGHVSPPAVLLTTASPVLDTNIKLGLLKPTQLKEKQLSPDLPMKVWAFPSLVKMSPLKSKLLNTDLGEGFPFQGNAVWDGSQVTLFGIKGEYVDFQLCVEALGGISNIRISTASLTGPNLSLIEPSEIEVFRNWYAKTKQGIWQPAYFIPVDTEEEFSIPAPDNRISNQTNQTFSIDVYIPKDAVAGTYQGEVKIFASGISDIRIPVRLQVYAAKMPDKLAFWPEMNAYGIPANVHDYYRLAHQNRCVANFWNFRPQIKRDGDKPLVLWKAYDRLVGPLLSGEAFKGNRRSGYPIECLYLPFIDSWPTSLTRKTYHYTGHWPGKGESINHLIDHYLKSVYIGDALSQGYKENFLAVQKQFIDHFKEKGWDRTELQCFFGGKKTHRINYGSNLWWTTDEPYHLGDWLALEFFTRLWTQGRNEAGGKENIWAARADISRPQWQGRVLEGRVNSVYYGGFNNENTYKRCQILKEETGVRVRAYGTANAHDRSNTETVALILNTWLNGADGFQVWWSTGSKKSLEVQEGSPGNGLFVPGERFGLPVVGDMRLKAFRKGEQLIEYLVLLSRKYGLTRMQLKYMIEKVLELEVEPRDNSTADDADSLRFKALKVWQIKGLRQEIIKLL